MADGRPYPQAPLVDTVIAVICLIVNIALLPGVGTIIGAVVAGERGVGKGIAQLILTIILIGWIWAIITGVQMLVNASWKEKQDGAAA